MSSKIFIIGARSNLSNKLYDTIDNSVLISSNEIQSNNNFLLKYAHIKGMYFIVNAFFTESPPERLNIFASKVKQLTSCC